MNYQVLQCYKCKAYQTHHKKKTLKWKCKVCGENQSYLKIILEDNAKQCGIEVRRLNKLRITGNIDSGFVNVADLFETKNSESNNNNINFNTIKKIQSSKKDKETESTKCHTIIKVSNTKKTSKWDKYLDDNKDENDNDELLFN